MSLILQTEMLFYSHCIKNVLVCHDVKQTAVMV